VWVPVGVLWLLMTGPFNHPGRERSQQGDGRVRAAYRDVGVMKKVMDWFLLLFFQINFVNAIKIGIPPRIMVVVDGWW
jgi:hypothetical protein